MTAMIDLAIHGGIDGKPVLLRDISRRQRISLSYLEQIFIMLRRHDIVKSVRGPGGGYLLNRPAVQLTVADIFDSSGEKRQMMLCSGSENCTDNNKCLTHDLWKGLHECIDCYLAGMTLADLVQSSEIRNIAKRQQAEVSQAAMTGMTILEQA